MFEIDSPEFAHLPHLVNDKGHKVSKEQSLETLIEKGFQQEALINCAALLGWNPPHREDPSVISAPLSVFMKHETLSIKDLIGTVRLLDFKHILSLILTRSVRHLLCTPTTS
jgi:glutamyl/glutaminyl-tRNA synthetase